ncbi:glycosyltransferase family 4 protein [Leptothermofonsia sp. ETS-13]|uniref:glycosyltransferase family 4 protein n=1 Tax=Leptothermofonsia sp. ETS-13 TaxID=3035696 RepID=UPI003BA34B3C
MNVLQINQFDFLGGAAIAAYRLHQGLIAKGFSSKLLVGAAKTGSRAVAVIPRKYRLENQLSRLTSPLGLNNVNLLGAFDIPKHPYYQEADVLNFHNLHNGYFNYLALPSLTKNKPAIITLHDMWSFTGHCAYSFGCDRWKTGCGKCPHLDAYPSISKDCSHLEWKLKDWVYSRSRLTVVTPSKWMAEQAKQSMLKRFPIHHIPNGVDTEAYQPLDPEVCRAALGIPGNKKVLIFGAQRLTDSRKGGNSLLEALQKLPDSIKAEIVLLTLGDGSEGISTMIGMPIFNLGYVSSDRLKTVAYSAADLLVFPTRADNLPIVLQESMACGTPAVSCKVGGVPELIRPGVTGYLAEPGNPADLCKGILELLEDHALRDRLGQHCREIAVQEYSLELQVKRYTDLYQQAIGQFSGCS